VQSALLGTFAQKGSEGDDGHEGDEKSWCGTPPCKVTSKGQGHGDQEQIEPRSQEEVLEGCEKGGLVRMQQIPVAVTQDEYPPCG
jgi:hypothetical protein